MFKNSIDKFLVAPESCNLVKLKGFEDYYRIRSGDYRIIFEKIHGSDVTIKFLKADHRSQIYEKL